MTVATTSSKITFNGNGSTTVFPFTFSIPGGLTTSQAAALLVVTFVDANGASTVVPFGTGQTQYNLTVNAPVSPNPTSVGGTVIYNPSFIPIPTGTTLTIERVVPETQGVSLLNQGTLWQTVIEQALDYLTMVTQQITGTFGRAVVGPASDPAGIIYTLPSATARANQALVFDNQGNVGTGVIPATGVISSAMAPVVGAASLPAARAAMGLGNAATLNVGSGLQNDGSGNLRTNMAFIQDAASPTNVDVSFANTRRVVGSDLFYVLPRANTLWNGFSFSIYNQTNVCIVNADPNDNIDGAPSIVVPRNGRVVMATDAANAGNWRAIITGITAVPPQGRLSTVTNQPVPTADTVSGNIFYTADIGSTFPWWTGAEFISMGFSSDMLLILDSTNHPAGKAFDIFATAVGGGIQLVTGPAWTSGSVRAAALGRVAGLYTNGVSITGINNNVPISIPANQGTYLGTCYCQGAGVVAQLPAFGQSRFWGLWNAYNRRRIRLRSGDPTASWSYSANAWRASNNATPNSNSFIIGLQDSFVSGVFRQNVAVQGSLVSDAQLRIGVGVDSATVPTGLQGRAEVFQFTGASTGYTIGSTLTAETSAELFGVHFHMALENGLGTGGTLFGQEDDMVLVTEFMG